MQYSLKQCKDDMLLLWGYLKEHPEVDSKVSAFNDLLVKGTISVETYKRFAAYFSLCPTCEFALQSFNNKRNILMCVHCPIWKDKKDKCFKRITVFGIALAVGEYAKWEQSLFDWQRKKWATRIYNMALKIKA